MKKFLIRTTVTVSIILGFNLAVFVFNYFYSPHLVQINTNKVIMGNSVIRRGLDPAEFKSAVNLASPGEPYLTTFHKLKYLLERFEAIDTVIIGFSYLDLSYRMDEKFSTPDKGGRYIQHSMSFMSPIPFFNETLASNKLILTSLYQSECLYPKFKDHVFVNGFEAREPSSYLGDMAERVQYFFENEDKSSFAKTNISYLHRIVALCEENNKELFLLMTPKHPDFRKVIPEEFKTKYASLSSGFERMGTHIIDYSLLLKEDIYYADYVHLSKYGAKELTLAMKSVIGN